MSPATAPGLILAGGLVFIAGLIADAFFNAPNFVAALAAGAFVLCFGYALWLLRHS
jgi:hypothetical protein